MANVSYFYVIFVLLFLSCEFVSCHKQPNYGYEGERACFCSTHKLPTMVDVKHRSGLTIGNKYLYWITRVIRY